MNQTTMAANPFSKENFTCLKGYLAICVLIHHLHQFTGFLADTPLGYPLLLLGHWAVVVFIFMSGYGLYSSYLAKGDSYIKSFPRTRLLPFYLSYLFFVLVYGIYEAIFNTAPTPIQIIKSLTYGGTIVSFGWYLQLTLLMYVLFYALKLIFKNDLFFIRALGLAILTFVLINFFLSSQKNVYEPALSFYAGVVVAYLKPQPSSRLLSKPGLYALLSLCAFILFTIAGTYMVFRLSNLMEADSWYDMAYLVLMIWADASLIVFVLSFLASVGKAVPKIILNPASKFLGTYSLEIYTLQGLVLRFLSDKIGNRVIYAAVATLCIIVIAVPVHKLLALIKKKC